MTYGKGDWERWVLCYGGELWVVECEYANGNLYMRLYQEGGRGDLCWWWEVEALLSLVMGERGFRPC